MSSLSSFKIEVHSLSFVSTDTMTLVFSQNYTTTPTITATAVTTGLTDDNVSVYIESATTTSAEIRISAITNANVHVQIIGT